MYCCRFRFDMSLLNKVVPLLLLAVAVATLDGCSSAKPKFEDDQLFSSTASPYSHNFDFPATDACEAARRGLLSQGYMTTMTRTDAVDATKNFQPASDSHIVVEVHVVCTSGDAANTSVVYVNAIQNGYALKKSDTSASVGLSIFGSLSVPIRTNSDAMVKISSETIQSGSFYEKFFDLLGHYLRSSARSEPVPRGSVEISPLPPPVSPSPPVAVVTPTAPAVALATRAVAPVVGGNAAAGVVGAAAVGSAAAAVETAAAVQSPTSTDAAAHAVAATLPGIGMPPILSESANGNVVAAIAPAQGAAVQPAAAQVAAAAEPANKHTSVAPASAAAQTLAAQTPTTQTPAASTSPSAAAAPAASVSEATSAAAASPASVPSAAAPAAQ
jgi:hypothetical protein